MQLSRLRKAMEALRPQLPAGAWELFELQQTVLEDTQARIKELEARLNQNSKNSHRPPSSDGLSKPNAPGSESPEDTESSEPDAEEVECRASVPPKRKSGGQPGHRGSTLQAVADPDDHVRHHLDDGQCACGASLAEGPRYWVSRQVFDIPPIKVQVVEHQIEHCTCGKCGAVVAADAPPWVSSPVQYGPQLRAMAVSLHVHQLIPFGRLKELLSNWLGVNISEGSLRNWLHRGYERLTDFVDGLKERIAESAVCGTDETSLRIEGRTQWLHTLSTERYVWQIVHPKRGKEAHQAMGVLERYRGILEHDAYHSYNHYSCVHALCNAHLIRELRALVEQHGAIWAQQWLDELLRIKALVDQAKQQGNAKLEPQLIASTRAKLQLLTHLGLKLNPQATRKPGQKGRTPQSKPRNLLLRLQNRLEDYLRFATDFRVPFDNNQSERDLRMAKVKQKVSGCHRSRETAQVFARLKSYLLTAKRQGIQAAEAMADLYAFQKIPLQIVKGQ